MKTLSKHAIKMLSDLRKLTEEEFSSFSWIELCVLMTKFCAIISVGLLLVFTFWILIGLGHEITITKLVGGLLLLVVWPFGMGFMIGSGIFLRVCLRRMIQRLLGKKKTAEQDAP